MSRPGGRSDSDSDDSDSDDSDDDADADSQDGLDDGDDTPSVGDGSEAPVVSRTAKLRSVQPPAPQMPSPPSLKQPENNVLRNAGTNK